MDTVCHLKSKQKMTLPHISNSNSSQLSSSDEFDKHNVNL